MLAALVLPALCSAGRVAGQSPPPNEPTWAVQVTPDSRCFDDAVLVERLTAQIPEEQRATLGQAELRAEVSIGTDGVATVRVLDQLTQREAGQRQIAVPKGGCDAAADALSLIIAVMIEAGRSLSPSVAEVTPPPAEPEPQVEPDPERTAAPKEEPARRASRRVRRHAWLGPPPGHDLVLAAGTSYGLLPGWSVGANAGWGIRSARMWPIWLSATGWLNEPSADLRARMGAAYGTLSTCPLTFENGRFRGQLCPGVSLGALWAEGRRVVQSERSTSPLAMANLTANAHLKLVGPLELMVQVRGDVPVLRLTFVYYREDGQAPTLHETQPVTVTFFGGLGLRFR